MFRPQLFRQVVSRRFASTSSQQATEAAQKAAAQAQEAGKVAAEKAKVAAEKAGEGLKKAGALAQNVLGGLSKQGGRVGKAAQKIEGLIPPTIYYSKVGLELAKIVFRQRAMSPPTIEVFQTTHKSLWQTIKSGYAKMDGAAIVQRVRNTSRADVANAGVVACELLGFWTVGEMIGKRKIVGYRHKVESHH